MRMGWLVGLAVAGVVAVGVLVGSVAAEPSALPAGNLVKNPGAEAGAGGLVITEDVSPVGWTTEGRGKGDLEKRGITVIKYQSPGRGYLHSDVAAVVGGGRNYFAGGQNLIVSTAAQTIAVGRAAAEIDAGGVKACLSGYLGGFRNNPDAAQVDVGFRAEDEVLLGQLRIGPVTAGQRNNDTTLLRRAAEKAVPANTRQLRVVLTARSPGISTNYGFADNITVGLTKGSCEPVLTVKCVTKALVATVTPSTVAPTQRVRFAVKGGKTKHAQDGRAPFTSRFTMDGLTGKLTATAAVTQKGGETITLTKKSRRC